MRGFDLSPDFMPGNTAFNLAVKVGSGAKGKQGNGGGGESPGPAYQEKYNDAQKETAQEDCQADPREAIAALV